MLCHLLSLFLLPQVIDPPPRVERLENGLRVAIVEERALPLVSVQLWYRVGAASDAIEQPGLCHVARTTLEHRDDAALKLRAAGVRFESKTLRDACYSSSVLPPDFLEYVLDIDAGRMRPISVDADTVETALRAAARDYGLNPDEPDQLAERRLLAAMFPGHPYQHPPGFIAEKLEDLKPIDVQEFLDHWFVPGNATLFIIGDVSTVSALELARKHFGSLQWREPPRRAESRSPEAGTAHASMMRADRAGIDLAWLTPPAGYFENAAFDVLMHRLCNPVDGPLCERLLKAGCSPPRWHREAWRNAGMLVLSIDVLASGATGGLPARALLTAEDLERVVRDELAKMAETIPTEIEHNRARALAMRDVRNRRAAFGNRARILAAHEIIAGDLLLAEFELPRLGRVAVPDLQAAAGELLATRMVTLQRSADRADRPSDTPDSAATLTLPLKAESPAQPASAPASQPAPVPSAAATRELANGLRISYWRVRGRELAEIRTVLRGDEQLSEAVGALMAVGSTRHSVDQIRDYLSYHGLDLFPLMEASPPGLRSRGPATHMAQMIELQAEVICYPDRSESACRTGSRRIDELLRQPGIDAVSNEAETYLAPGLIAWVPIMATLETANFREALRRLEHVQAVEVLVVADVEPERVFEAVELAWSDWSPPPAVNEGRP
jgi:predicted Zn-dependent peptidase